MSDTRLDEIRKRNERMKNAAGTGKVLTTLALAETFYDIDTLLSIIDELRTMLDIERTAQTRTEPF